MRLYNSDPSSASYRVRIALNLKGVSAELLCLQLRDGAQRDPAYAAINPQCLVPTLTLDDGTALTQSLAIIDYLDETHPEPPFLPRDARLRAWVRAVALAIACDIHPLNNLRVLQYLEHDLKQDADAVKTWYAHWIRLGFDALERQLVSPPVAGNFCCGDAPGLADICLVPQVRNARRYQIDLSAYPRIVAIDAACAELDAFRRANPA
ncbi:MAG: maleylacetoacetate isomerase [Proteobacteria bacterium]|nr:maleylacetoacetate isomerase [Pseudomonadota bacterium]